LDLASKIELNWHKVFLQMLHETSGQILLGCAVLVYLIFPTKPFDPERLDTFELSHL